MKEQRAQETKGIERESERTREQEGERAKEQEEEKAKEKDVCRKSDSWAIISCVCVSWLRFSIAFCIL